MSRKMSQRAAIETAAKALADLNAFGNIIAICESGNFYAPSHAGADRIIRICQTEIAKRCREYDAAIEKATAP